MLLDCVLFTMLYSQHLAQHLERTQIPAHAVYAETGRRFMTPAVGLHFWLLSNMGQRRDSRRRGGQGREGIHHVIGTHRYGLYILCNPYNSL